MRRFAVLAALSTAMLTSGPSPVHAAEEDLAHRTFFAALLRGANEVPSVSSTGRAAFAARLNSAGDTLSFVLRYADLEGPAIGAAHVHFGQAGANGGVMFFMCGGGGKPPCPPAPATITGTVVAADVLGPAAQGIAAGEFDEVVKALRSGLAYANIHTDKHPGGEIRGQVH